MTTQIAKRQEEIKAVLAPAHKQIKSLLADDAKASKFTAAALVVASDPALMGCSADSVVQSLIGVAMLDLNIDKNVGHCYLLKYGNACQLQIGYKGYMQLLYRAGWLVKAFPVFDCDDFSISFDGWDNKVSFTPNLDERDEGDKVWCYHHLRGIYVVSRNSETKDEYSTFVSKNIIEKLRKNSPNQKNAQNAPTGIWADWYVEMAISKAIKKLAKMLPIGDSRAALALAVDDKSESGAIVDYAKTAETGVIIDVEHVEHVKDAKDVKNSKLRFADDLKRETPNGLVDDPFRPWLDRIDDCQTISDIAAVLSDMPPKLKPELKHYVAKRQNEIKEQTVLEGEIT